MRALFTAPREMAAFKAAGGEPAALQAGYHAKDMPMLARAFTLVKGLTDKAAMRPVDFNGGTKNQEVSNRFYAFLYQFLDLADMGIFQDIRNKWFMS